MKRVLPAAAMAALWFTWFSVADSAVLCTKKSGTIVVRNEACRRKEKPLDLTQFGAVGPKGDKGDPGPASPTSCSPDAVLVGASCVDKYEASVWQIDPTNAALVQKVRAGEATLADLTEAGATQLAPAVVTGPCPEGYGPNFPADGNWSPAPFTSSPPGVYAISIPGVLPSTCITWLQANQACAFSGKRLLSNDEWQRAAAGTPDGVDNGTTSCAVSSPNAVNAGARSDCKSSWGAFDMVGNVNEWVADWLDRGGNCANWTNVTGIPGGDLSCFGGTGSGTANNIPGAVLRGGAWNADASAGVFTVGSYAYPSDFGGTIGFRCAR